MLTESPKGGVGSLPAQTFQGVGSNDPDLLQRCSGMRWEVIHGCRKAKE